jgi:hypothetical protein
MRPVEGHQQGQTKQDVAVFTESAAVKVSYICYVRVRNRAIIAPSGMVEHDTHFRRYPIRERLPGDVITRRCYIGRFCKGEKTAAA